MENKESKILEILLEMQKDINGLKSDVNEVKSDVNGLKSDVNGLKYDLKRMEEKSENGFAIMGKHFMEVKKTLQQRQQTLENLERNTLDTKEDLLSNKPFTEVTGL